MKAADGYTSLALLVSVSGSRIVCGLAIVKALSYLLGPARFGALSQIIGVTGAFYALAGGGITNGLILHVGRETDAGVRRRWLQTGLTVGAASGALLGLTAILLYGFGARAVFGDAGMANLFFGIGVAQVVVGAGNILLAFASGSGDVRTFAAANIAGGVAAAVLIVAATAWFGFEGAQWAVVLSPMATALAAFALVRRRAVPGPGGFPSLGFLWRAVDRIQVIHLLRASGWMLLAVVALPIAQAFLRADLAGHDGWQAVGLWQSVARLSDSYMQVFGVIVVNLLLPRLLARRDTAARNAEFRRMAVAIMGLFAAGAVTLYVLREPVMRLAFSAEFLPATQYVVPQLWADFAKVGAWIMVYRFIASGRLWAQPAAEIFQAVTLVASYLALRPAFGALAPVLGHLVSCTALVTVLGVAAWRVKD